MDKSLRLTTDVMAKLLKLNDGFKDETEFGTIDISGSVDCVDKGFYEIKEGKLYYRSERKKGNEIIEDEESVCDINKTRTFLRNRLWKLNTDIEALAE